MDLCILYTSDTHSQISPRFGSEDKEDDADLSNFFSLLNVQRSIYKENCLAFDNGNKLSGSPTAYYYKFCDTISEPICYRAERLIGYDGVGIGSHDIEVPECLAPTRHDNSKQPITLCANLVNKQNGNPVYKPYHIYERQGIRIAVFGMIAPTSGDWLPNELWNNFDTEDMIECAKHWIPIIKEKEKADIIVGLFSCDDNYGEAGGEFDIETYKNPSGGLPAAMRVPGFNLVLLGNSPKSHIGQVKDDEGHVVPYIQCGANCKKAGLARVHLQKKDDGTYATRVFTSLVDLSQYESDPVFSNHFKNAQDSIYLWFSRPISFLDKDLKGDEGIYGPDDFRDFINDVQLWYSKADISLSSSINPSAHITSGPITMQKIFELYPFTHQLQTMNMTGEEVRRLLEWGYNCQFVTMRSPQDSMLSVVKDKLGHVLYDEAGSPTLKYPPSCYISAGGIRYTVNLTENNGSRVEILSWEDGTPFDPRGLYKVAISSELLRNEGKFLSKGLNWDHEELALHAVPSRHNSLRKVLYDYCVSHDTIRLDHVHNWSIIPEKIWQEASERERRDLAPIW